MNTNLHSNEYILFIAVAIMAIFFLVCFILDIVNRIKSFLSARNFIKDEMFFSSGDEYFYWKKELKKLYITSIPIIGMFLEKQYSKKSRKR